MLIPPLEFIVRDYLLPDREIYKLIYNSIIVEFQKRGRQTSVRSPAEGRQLNGGLKFHTINYGSTRKLCLF